VRRAPASLLLLALCPLGAPAADAPPGNPERGAALHAAHCTGCHGDEVYTRPDRRIRSFPALVRRVQACNRNIGAGMTPAQVHDVIAYLNRRYYRFERKEAP